MTLKVTSFNVAAMHEWNQLDAVVLEDAYLKDVSPDGQGGGDFLKGGISYLRYYWPPDGAHWQLDGSVAGRSNWNLVNNTPVVQDITGPYSIRLGKYKNEYSLWYSLNGNDWTLVLTKVWNGSADHIGFIALAGGAGDNDGKIALLDSVSIEQCPRAAYAFLKQQKLVA